MFVMYEPDEMKVPVKVWLKEGSDLEKGCMEQAYHLSKLPFLHKWVSLMPDTHAGMGMPIGGVIAAEDVVIPNAVGVDIGCGMAYTETNIKVEDIRGVMTGNGSLLQAIIGDIMRNIPVGFGHHKTIMPCYTLDMAFEEMEKYEEDAELLGQLEAGYFQIGTLGGGNHFIEMDRDTEGKLYLVVHSGSRHLGLEVAHFYQNEAYKALNGNSPADVEALIREYKAAGREKEIQKALKELKAQVTTTVPKALAYCEGKLLEDYIHDMTLVQHFAKLNRKAMMDEMIRGMSLKVEEQFTTIHNYIDTENMILRKGAVSAQAGEKLLIPINMRDGSLICIGKGNEDWNFSAPHGAGRLMSRTQAKKSCTVSEFRKEMEGIYTTSVNAETLDECPMAYKGMQDIVDNIGDTAKILTVIKPVYNFKAGGEG